ncbi:hypothetical protein PQ455_02835 [Sphingomonas naphthae]|uniref:Uncharacterized protein n=1 Tax=Sphingomonas naphthae TaxID=1813468 RepID=A0ABY7TP61_9SPHN|nr:hypothetical protein [Sphingomonas naphthae]WCT74185.1 hypothetical protein PQ455_02835 [Sphingomonas naphthae]
MKDLYDALKLLARRYHSRWSALDDALTRIRASDGEGRNTPGEPARRMLLNAFRVQTYVEDTRDRYRTDITNAKRKLAKPLAEALGHIITIELGEEMLAEIDAAEGRRLTELGEAEQCERPSADYGPLIDALHKAGVARGNYTALTPVEIAAIARYIRKKIDQRLAELPPIRTGAETHSSKGRLHPFWNAYGLPEDGQGS